jgi:hypothetical protein
MPSFNVPYCSPAAANRQIERRHADVEADSSQAAPPTKDGSAS